MDRNMFGFRDQSAARVEQGTGEIFPLLDVGREAGPAENDAHFVRCRDERVLDNLEGDGVDSQR